jgi:uncharacterized membrane protein YgcG
MTTLISIIVMVAALWFVVGFLDKRKAKKAARQAAWEEAQLQESRLKSREAELKYKLYQAQNKDEFTREAMLNRVNVYQTEHSNVEEFVRSDGTRVSRSTPRPKVNKSVRMFTPETPNHSNSSGNTLLNTVLATAVINDGFISSDSTKSESDTFSGNGGSFGGGGSSGSWDTGSSSDSSSSSSYDSGSSPSYDSGGGFDSGGGSFGSD